MPDLAHKLHPLHAACTVKGQSITWTDTCQQAFESAKSALAKATLLNHPREGCHLAIMVDASDVAVGGSLNQLTEGQWEPLAFFSKKLSPAQRKYATFDKELLAAFLGVKQFRHYVEGKSFTIYTDHKPLVGAMTNCANHTPRQTRHLSFIAEFTTDVQHLSGTANCVADALSRAPAVSAVLSPDINYAQFAADQEDADVLKNYQTPTTSLQIEKVPFGAATVWCDTSLGHPRPIVPNTWKRRIFDICHGLSHSGCRPTLRAISKRFVWQSMRADVRDWCQSCQPCQSSKIQRHVHAPLQARPPPDRRFGSLHVDLVGPLPESEGMRYLFTIIDRYSRWSEAIPIPEMKTDDCIKAFIRHWVARFGVPGDLTSDRGRQFTSNLWKQLNRLLGIQASNTTAYHPQANGLVERMHRQLKASLMARLKDANWMNELPMVMLGIRTAWREDAGCSPAELVYGTTLHIPGEFFVSPRTSTLAPGFLGNLQETMRQIQPQLPKYHTTPTTYLPADLGHTGYVYVRVDSHRKPLQRPYSGPYKVIKTGEKCFDVEIKGKKETVTVDRLKTAYKDNM